MTSMAVTSPLVVAGSQLRCHNFRRTRHWALTLSWEKQQLKRAQKCGGDENPWKPVKIVMRVVDHHPRDGDVSYGLHKDLVSLPSGC